MSYIAKRKNRVIHIAEEKAEEYAKMGYTVKKENGETVFEPEATTLEGANITVKILQDENAELKAKLDEVTKYAENADKKIAALEVENAELKASVAPAAKKSSKTVAKTAEKVTKAE